MNRDHIVSMRVTATEREALQRLADRHGVPLSEMLRRNALRGPQAVLTPASFTTSAPRASVIWNSAPPGVTCYP